jgi:hypothetical protein
MAAQIEPISGIAGAFAEDAGHIIEIAEILAVGLTRLEARKSSRKSADFGESSLHFTPDQSGDAHSPSAEASHD